MLHYDSLGHPRLLFDFTGSIRVTEEQEFRVFVRTSLKSQTMELKVENDKVKKKKNDKIDGEKFMEGSVPDGF